MAELAAGKFDVVLPGLGRKDEIGDIAVAVEAFKHKAIEKAHLGTEAEALRRQRETDAAAQRQHAEQELQMKAAEERAKAAEEITRVVRSLAQGLKRLSSGDLACRLDDEFSPAYQQIRDDFNTALSGLQETVGSIVDVAREVAGASAEISASTTDLSQRTEEQAASLEHNSASMEEISGTVKQNAQSAEAANASDSATCDVAQHSSEVVTKAVAAMARIEESSRKISDIIGVIDEIARQTNLLALNAAVEAARAGEAGRGFAVVASEVRSLAQRSAQAAKDIKDLITNSSVQVREGADLVNGAGASLGEIAESTKKVAAIIADIANASAEQAIGIEQINKTLTQMDEATQQNSALVEENAATAKTLEQQAKAMDERISFFKLNSAVGRRQAA
jgi:methyl-accepting chemotaxis protein